KRADSLGARFALVIGELELSTGKAKLKELKTGEQHEVDLARLAEQVKALTQNTPPSAA
ncbi:MAG: His/Gly/Thr/Pro-type tRNA ligase C-terminal domain-containing protein, partial [Myxococcales bacterium]